jgi:hypothetical protein
MELEARTAPGDTLASILFAGPFLGIGGSLLWPSLVAAGSRTRPVPAESVAVASRLPASPAGNTPVSSVTVAPVAVASGPAAVQAAAAPSQVGSDAAAGGAASEFWSATGLGRSPWTLAGFGGDGDGEPGGQSDSRVIDAAVAGLTHAANRLASPTPAANHPVPADNAPAATTSRSVTGAAPSSTAADGSLLAKLAGTGSGARPSGPGGGVHPLDSGVATTTTATISPASTVYGQEFFVDVTVTAADGEIPTGDVELVSNGVVLDSIGLDSEGDAAAPLVGANLPADTPPVFPVNYVPTAGSRFLASSTNVTESISPVPTETLVTSSLNPATYGQAVTFTADVINTQTSQPPDGNITFVVFENTSYAPIPLVVTQAPPTGITIDGQFLAGGSLYSTASLTVAGDAAGLLAGVPSVTAKYFGDNHNNFGPSTGTLEETVNSASTATTTASGSGATYAYGQKITLSGNLTVTYPSPLANGVPLPTGNLTFGVSGGPAGIGTLLTPSGNGEVSSFTPIQPLPPGTYPFVVRYQGQANSTGDGPPDFAASSANSTFFVNKGGTTVVLTSSQNPSTFGSTVTFTATVKAAAPAVGYPTGSMTFQVNGVSVANIPMPYSSGTASYSTSSLNIGNNIITAIYSGDPDFVSSTSNQVTQDNAL